MRGKSHSDDVRAAAMAALLAGQGVAEVAAAYKLPDSTVDTWKCKLEAEFGKLRDKKGDEFSDLLAGYLRRVIGTLSVQAEHCADRSWLQKQSASEVAVLHGVLTDKAIRLLEAAEAAGGGE